ncbi:sucrase ferredoxin [Nocardioides alkalitolerans]|uniref:sucrase ferredoxin n=1 Tax=Nocardioides alkalitolerans TaxID=281714 RepID=UPI0004219DB5|nr:sucrase ferredoxin [Nocardioides alkalitolerans]
MSGGPVGPVGEATFRCAAASAADEEPLAGSAPTETLWLLVEQPGPWGRKALKESRLPDAVAAHLRELDGVAGARVQLVRRPGRPENADAARRVFLARRGEAGFAVASALLADDEVLALTPDHLRAGTAPGFAPYDAPLWLVCTNGRRDVCCAELGRPVVDALAARWPDGTWETTHLGGHRFSATLLALPSGLTLGRLDAGDAVPVCAAVAAGEVPVARTRGRAGDPGAVQAADLHLRTLLALRAADDVRREPDAQPDAQPGARPVFTVRRAGGVERWECTVTTGRGEPRRQSCGDDKVKPAATYAVDAERVDG